MPGVTWRVMVTRMVDVPQEFINIMVDLQEGPTKCFAHISVAMVASTLTTVLPHPHIVNKVCMVWVWFFSVC